MHSRTSSLVFYFMLAVAAASATAFPPPASSPGIRVAMVAYLFEGNDKDQMLKQMGPFIENMQKDTGTKAEFLIIDELATLTRELNENKVQIAILPSVDYGWMRAEAPGVKPILVAGVEGGRMKALVMSAKKSALAKLEDLKGKKLAWPSRSPQHLKFYLTREFGQTLDQSFQMQDARNVKDALDDVIDGKADFACVGAAQADTYKSQQPVRFDRLKVIAESVDFPPPVVVYQTKGADEGKIKKFVDAMKKANQTTEGQQTLTLWRLRGFEELPSDYEQQLLGAVKKYPRI